MVSTNLKTQKGVEETGKTRCGAKWVSSERKMEKIEDKREENAKKKGTRTNHVYKSPVEFGP